MSVDVSFAIAPHGLEEVISAMTATVAAVPYDTFATKWGKVAVCLRDARFLATVRDRRVLSRMDALHRLGGIARYGGGRTAASKDSRLLPGEGTRSSRRRALPVDLPHGI